MYKRVIPRDLFNEAKLLKCLGKLSLNIHNSKFPGGVEISVAHDGRPFRIMQHIDGSLYCTNLVFSVENSILDFQTTYNRKDNWPFYLNHDNIEYEVFDDEGEYTEEFIEAIKSINDGTL